MNHRTLYPIAALVIIAMLWVVLLWQRRQKREVIHPTPIEQKAGEILGNIALDIYTNVIFTSTLTVATLNITNIDLVEQALIEELGAKRAAVVWKHVQDLKLKYSTNQP